MRKESEQHMEDMSHQWVADCIGCGPVQLETWIVGIPTEQLVGLSTELDYKSIGWEARQTYFLIQSLETLESKQMQKKIKTDFCNNAHFKVDSQQ